MVKIPVFESSDALDVGTGLFRTVDDDNFGKLVGRGANALASGLDAVATFMQTKEDKLAKFEAEKNLIDLQDRTRKIVDKAVENIPESGKGFHASTLAAIQKEAQSVYDKLPDNVRADSELKLRRFLADKSDQLAKIETTQSRNFIKQVTERKISQLSDNVLSGTWGRDTAVEELDMFIKGAELPSERAQELRNLGVRVIESSVMEKLIADNPHGVFKDLSKFRPNAASAQAGDLQRMAIERAQAHGIDPVIPLTIGTIETRWNPNAKNSKTIHGIYQMTAANRAAYGLPEHLKHDPALQTEAFMRLLRDNQTRLQANGIPVTPQTMWGSHFLGMGGYLAFRKADPNADAFETYRAVAGDNIARQAFNGSNGKLLQPGMSVGQVLQQIDGFVAKGVVESTKYLTTAGGENAPAQGSPLVVAGQTFEGLTVADMGKYWAKSNEIVIKAEGNRLALEDKARLLDAQDPTIYNPYNEAIRKRIDDAAKMDQAQERIIQGDVEAIAKYTKHAEAGYLPRPAADAALLMIAKGDPQSKQVGYDLLAAAYKGNNQDGLRLADVPDARRNAVRDYVALVTHSGFKPDEAIRRVETIHSPDYKIKEADIRAKVEAETKKLSFQTVVDKLKLGTGGWFSGPDQRPEFKAVRNMFEERLQGYFRFHYMQTGDTELAKGRAIQDLERTHNYTKLYGDKPKLTLYPPEYSYSPVSPVMDGNGRPKSVSDYSPAEAKQAFGYILDQARAQVRYNLAANKVSADFLKNDRADQVVLLPTGDTRRDIEAGFPPRYNVMFKDKDGHWQLGVEGFRADVNLAREGRNIPVAAERDAPTPAAQPAPPNAKDRFRQQRGN